MRTKPVVLLMLGFVFTVLTLTGLAAINFKKADFSVSDAGNLVCGFDITGLGSQSNVNVTCAYTRAEATYQCENRGGNQPPPQKSVGFSSGVTEPFTATRNGRVAGSISVPPPPPGPCVDQMTPIFVSVEYCGVSLSATKPSTGETANFYADTVNGCVSAP
jgi:hypothetical protein